MEIKTAMSSLKTHLLYEALDIAFQEVKDYFDKYRRLKNTCFWGLYNTPQTLCAFAISSSVSYRIMAYSLKYFATGVEERGDRFECFAPLGEDRRFCVLRFSPKHYIRALMSLAGSYCTYIRQFDYCYQNNGFTDAFYDGLALNEVIDINVVSYDAKLFRAYMKGRKSLEHLVFYTGDHYCSLFDVGDVVVQWVDISSLYKSFNAASFAPLARMKIVHLEITPYILYHDVMATDIFRNGMPQLKFLKRLHYHCPIGILPVIEMLQRYHIEEMVFDDVRLLCMSLPLHWHARVLRRTVETLWKAVVDNRGTKIVVHCSDYNIGEQLCEYTSNATLINNLITLLPEFIISSTRDAVFCELHRTLGSKSLTIKFKFFVTSWSILYY
uniref:Uncharacterized protein n=1 Tax=Panagrellus redivivus TaxID=6233 RepID=A0A7E4UST3_PANRE